jgi:hypothetical protein
MTTAAGSDGKWIVCQIGAREHYVIAAELQRRGVLDLLLTDIWSAPGGLWGSVAFAARVARMGKISAALAGRFRQGVAARCPPAAVSVRWAMQFGKLERDKLFAQWAAGRVRERAQSGKLGARPVVFSYSYAAYEIGLAAKEVGATFVLGQIDGGPEEQELVRSLGEGQGLAPAADWRVGEYWDRWRRECELADVIVVNSEWSMVMLEREGVDRAKCRLVPLAYEAPPRAGAKTYPHAFTAERPLRVLFLGQLIPRKGIIDLLRCFDELADWPIELRLVGPADEQMRSRFVGRRNVIWKGNSPRSAVHEHYEWADLFVLPTHADGFAITQLEAQSFALPVIASKNCGCVVEDGVNGLLLKAVEPGEIRRTLSWVANNPARLQGMSNAAVGALERFSAGAVIAQLYDAIQGHGLACSRPAGVG